MTEQQLVPERIMRTARAEFNRQAAYRPLYWQFLLWCGRRACSAVLNAETQPSASLLTEREALDDS